MLATGPFSTAVTLRSGDLVLQHDTGDCFLDFTPRGPTLLVGFEGAGPQRDRPDGTRTGWGRGYAAKTGHSLLEVKPKRVDWYRAPALHVFFRSAEFAAWTRQFAHVVLFGTSMGGFAALAFAEAFPGCTVLAHNPQSTLAPGQVPWETRFHDARALDWSGDFADGAEAGRHAARVHLTYDPFYRLDRLHADRVRGAVVQHLKVPLVGHRVPEWLSEMGVLRKLTNQAVAGTLTTLDFARAVRRRRTLPRYYVQLAERTRSDAVRAWALGRAEAIDPGNGEIVGRGVLEHIGRDEFEEGIATFHRAPAMRGLPNAARANVLAAVALALVATGGSAAEAERQAAESLALSTEEERAQLFFARMRLLQGHDAKAEEHLRRALALRPDMAEAASLLAALSERRVSASGTGRTPLPPAA